MSRRQINPPGDVLDLLLPPVATWFRSAFDAPTPPQCLGWPAIAQGLNTLIVAPTGSGKTLAAFLACLDALWRESTSNAQLRGTRLLYISPLKALNVDIARNLVAPLEGISATSQAMGTPLRSLQVGVRTGDTPPAERRQLLRRPPDILITTPESLHLMLTSRARETLRNVRYTIIDEIHALCSNKRGVFLSVLLERLQAQIDAEFTRIGLSATQRPLQEVARFLGGQRRVAGQGTSAKFESRPVHIVDAGTRKDLDLAVAYPGPIAPGGSIWPVIEERLVDLISRHRSTIVFANNRRVVERLAASLNERTQPDSRSATDIDGPPAVVARPHHGSLSLDIRRATEDALKEGRLPAVVATASLELGIDMGAVDLVCQVESPGGVARGLQRVGRAGHVVGQISRGRLFAKTLPDLLESAALVRAMRAGEVEHLRVPTNCLDVLAQQVVACVAAGPIEVSTLFDLFRQSYPYRNLDATAFEDVLRMISGRFGLSTFRDLKPRVSWDRVHHRLLPLPGTAALAIAGGGTIPDTGQFPLILGDSGPRLGELDEEFVLERRIGETFRLGNGTWRIEMIDPHRVVVSPAAGQAAFMPFWRGEGAGRTAELGAAVAELTREIADRGPEASEWLAVECSLEPPAAEALARFVSRQKSLSGAVPDDRTILVESFDDPTGELDLVVLTPHGSKFHHALKLALQGWLRRRYGLEPAVLHSDDGILFRLPAMDDPPLDMLSGLTPDLAEELIRDELGDSALFGLRFRQNAARALLMPRPDPGRRTPLWLQRLRARDLLQAVRRHPDFPVVIETYRECLDSDLDIAHLRRILGSIQEGAVRVVTRQGQRPSPFASELLFEFTRQFLYEWDEPKRGDRIPHRPDEARLDAVLEGRAEGFGLGLDPAAIDRVGRRLRGERPPRSADEMAELLRRVGDLAPSELSGPMELFLNRLESEGRAASFTFPAQNEPERWISTEELTLHDQAFPTKATAPDPESRDAILARHVATRPLVGVADLVARYGLDPAEATSALESLVAAGDLVRLEESPEEAARWADRRNLADMRRLTLALRRRDSVAVTPEVFADFLLRRQHLHPSTQLQGEAALPVAMASLEGFTAPLSLWEQELLPRRIIGFRTDWLDDLVRDGQFRLRAVDKARDEPLIAFLTPEFAGSWPEPDPSNDAPSEIPHLKAIRDALTGRGACFVDELAITTGIKPSQVHDALRTLLIDGVVTVDRLDPIRKSADATADISIPTSPSGRPRLGRARRTASRPTQPRWWLWPTTSNPEASESDSSTLAWAEVLLDRHAVLCRETAAADPAAPPWRELADPLHRAELRGELRRGYFVEGLSGIQYALPEIADELARHDPKAGAAPPVLIPSLDPANPYGSGAPLDIPLLEGGTAKLLRNAGNFLVLIAGRPILIIEAHGKRLTGLPSASESELRAALALLPSLAGPGHRVIKVDTYNTAPALASPAAPWLAALGFVRNPPGLALYAGW